jgi:hypothetical protein
MSSKSPMEQEKNDFSREAFYSMLNDSATDCNTFCGSANQTCYKNCVSKNQQLIHAMRDFLLYANRPEKILP